MIEKRTSKSGHQILRRNNAFLCSTRDPIKEAQDWVDLYKSELQSNLYQTYFILGLGCGYKVQVLANLLPEKFIVGVESDIEIYQFNVQKFNSKYTHLKLLHADHPHDLIRHPEIAQRLKSRYFVLEDQQTTHENTNLQRLKQFLLARSPEGASFFIKNNNLNDEFSIKDVPANELVGIKHINIKQDKKTEFSLTHEILEELIK
ncbi:MAG: hypothetical protein KDD50_04785 [Bdellovibrionales bacterium]|nr:hypothetical protein [Bdellovibrionales bacterium]